VILLIGSGPMAVEYAKVLKAQNQKFTVIGRGSSSADYFKDKTGVSVIGGGFEKYISDGMGENTEYAIVAVGVESLFEAGLILIKKGVKNILLEKPGALNLSQIKELNKNAIKSGSKVFIAYNRRYLSSVYKAEEIIKLDGGVTSFAFDFTEWSNEISRLNKEPGVKERWLIANSSHVIDLAFYLGGIPEIINTQQTGKLDWHSSGSIFVGSGLTKSGALFSYHANWDAPGRWGLEFCTQKHKIILRPMEKLQIIKRDSLQIEYVELGEEQEHLDIKFKPGLYRQVDDFIGKKKSRLCTINEMEENIEIYSKIAAYEC
jgi:predicted dehydrogenase